MGMGEVWVWESPSLLSFPSYLLVGGIVVCVGVVCDLPDFEMGSRVEVGDARGVDVHVSV